MTDDEIKKMGEEFESLLNEYGVTNIKDITTANKEDDYNKDVWVIK